MVELNWEIRSNGEWHSFLTVNLEKVKTQGIYIIWYSGDPGLVVYVGQGDVSERIKCHRDRPEITQYKNLLVTWAKVPESLRDGVERYLANRWEPLVGDAYPDAVPIAVNSPWE
jgi:hypothetical protein